VPSDAEDFDPLPLLEALSAGGVDFVVIGGVAGGAHGSAYPTYDLDVASLDHLIAMKQASGRTKDKLMATEYRVLSDELRAPRD
jgi:hypothetical protein